jgi:hypothetical protein
MNEQIVEEKNVPRVLLEIFIYGEESNKVKIAKNLDELQVQLAKSRKNRNKARLMYYLDKGEKTVEEKIEWFTLKAKCKYFIAIDGTKLVAKDFIKSKLQKIRTFENSFNSLKSSNINILGMKAEENSSNDGIQNAEIIE